MIVRDVNRYAVRIVLSGQHCLTPGKHAGNLSEMHRLLSAICAVQEMAEMYVGDDVSPDFYGWVFPKYDHVGVGTGTVVNRPAIKDYQVRVQPV